MTHALPPLLHLSDTHFGTERAPVVEALVRLVHQQSPGVAVLSGDVTQRATRAQFAAARAFIDRLRVPHWVVIPGNHDIPLFDIAARLLRPYGRYQATFGTALAPSAETPDWLVIAHKTTRRYRHANGELSRAQIARTAERLRQARRQHPQQLRVVVVHQPLAVAAPQDAQDVLHNAATAVREWAAAGADLVLSGHTHLPVLLPLHLRGLCATPFWAVQAGTAVSSRTRAGQPNTVNLLHPAPPGAERGCRVERWDYDAARDAFALARSDTVVLPLHQTP